MSPCFWFGHKPSPASGSGLSSILLGLSPSCPWAVRETVRVIVIWGSGASGKWSGSGAEVARTMLGAGFGGRVPTLREGAVGESRRQGKKTVIFDGLRRWRTGPARPPRWVPRPSQRRQRGRR